MRVLTSSQTAEWYTPSLYTDAVREVLGGIDLDPASCAAANEWIGATTYYTEDDDGLSKPWRGLLFINPPYGKTGSRSNQDIWASRLVSGWANDSIHSAILLTKSVPGYKWWDNLFRFVRPTVCFVSERIKFLRLNKYGRVIAEGQAKAGSNFWYFGYDRRLFERVFERFGRVV